MILYFLIFDNYSHDKYSPSARFHVLFTNPFHPFNRLNSIPIVLSTKLNKGLKGHNFLEKIKEEASISAYRHTINHCLSPSSLHTQIYANNGVLFKPALSLARGARFKGSTSDKHALMTSRRHNQVLVEGREINLNVQPLVFRVERAPETRREGWALSFKIALRSSSLLFFSSPFFYQE